MLLSLIIPFYQVEKYIAACLENLCTLDPAQTEILLVDDCGTDGSLTICQSFCARCACMRILSRPQNGGLSAARNTGLAQARGEYVYFLDSDDICHPQALFRLALEARSQSLDVIKARFTVFDDGTEESSPPSCVPPPTSVLSGDTLLAQQCRKNVYEPMVWQCLYRRAFLQAHQLRMPEGLLFEDELFQAQALLLARRARMSDVCILRYRQRPGSIMKTFHRSADWGLHYLEICRRLQALCTDSTPGTRMLRRRVGQIALNVAKNIVAYDAAAEIHAQSFSFLQTHKHELAAFAWASRDPVIAAQGILLDASPSFFLTLYRRARS